MELSGVIVLALVGCVTCSPYGYGVKSAAVAKADANASGTFGGALPVVPLSIPSSGGISGSFSKTSSSSFAASSSSSSSSSSSFSYGGTNGVAGNSIPSSPHGSPGAHNAFGASGTVAQAAASANAVAGSSTLTQNAAGLPCSGNDCYNAGNTNQQQTDLNDFEVHIGGNPKPSNTLSHGQTSGFDKSGCFYKKCGTNIGLAPSENAASTSPQQPAIHLSTPNIEPACSTHDCNAGSTGANLNNGKPSSYNVPILGGNQGEGSPYYNSNARPTGPLYDAPSKSITTPKIPSYSDGIYSSQLPTNSAESPSCNGLNCNSLNNPAHQPSHPSCSTPNCDVHISSGPSSQAGYVKPGTVPSLTQTTSFGVSGSGSNSGQNAFSGYSDGSLKPNYNNPTPNAGLLNIVAHPGSIEPPKTNLVSPSQNTPGYTSGFGTLTGSINANLESVKPTTGFGTSGASVLGQNNVLKPSSSVVPSSQNTPLYTGGFGGSPGSFDTHTGSNYQFKPNNENPSSTPSTITHDTGIAAGSGHVSLDLPNPDSSVHSAQSTPSHTGGFGTPTGSIDANFGPFKPTTADIHSHNKPHIIGGAPVTGLHGSFGVKPESSVGSLTQTSTIYTGGFGGSPGSINTNSKIGTHFESKLTHNKIPSGANTAPSSADQKGSVATNYGSGLSYNHDTQKPVESLIPPHTGISSTGHAGASNALKPGLLKPIDENTKLPTYSGGFGGPSGILKPNEYSVSTNLPTSPIGHTSCASGNCGLSTVHKVEKGKENILSSGASSDASASANAYSGSFGGPPGLFKPFDDGKPTKHEHDGYAEKDVIADHDKPASGVNSEYGNTPVVKEEFGGVNKAPHASVNADNAGANANAAAIASSNAFSANQGIGSSGCNSGCSSNYNTATGGSFASNLGSSSGALGGHGSLVGSLASANSVAGAGAGTFGTGRSFASSSASAHSSAGAAVKGGYGRR